MTLKEEFLKPLDEDRELRLTVVKKLSYGDILKKLERRDREFNRIQQDKKARGILTK
jgi:hypothetical protein